MEGEKKFTCLEAKTLRSLPIGSKVVYCLILVGEMLLLLCSSPNYIVMKLDIWVLLTPYQP